MSAVRKKTLISLVLMVALSIMGLFCGCREAGEEAEDESAMSNNDGIIMVRLVNSRPGVEIIDQPTVYVCNAEGEVISGETEIVVGDEYVSLGNYSHDWSGIHIVRPAIYADGMTYQWPESVTLTYDQGSWRQLRVPQKSGYSEETATFQDGETCYVTFDLDSFREIELNKETLTAIIYGEYSYYSELAESLEDLPLDDPRVLPLTNRKIKAEKLGALLEDLNAVPDSDFSGIRQAYHSYCVIQAGMVYG